MRQSRITLVLAVIIVSMAACDVSTSPHVAAIVGNSATASSSTLTITPVTAQMLVGGSTQFRTNAPANLLTSLQWSTSQPNVAAVNNTGLVTALGAGTTTVSVRYSFDTTTVANATVTVTGTAGANTGPTTMPPGNP
ncbi:MAG TPA: Ig-like domain-containing protein [Gemmatimonadaceae bacterium]|nr:Ig-like domain-containing protein [Gemmatimonadaceae bacterium]